MRRTNQRIEGMEGRSEVRRLALLAGFAGATLLPFAARAEAAKADPAARADSAAAIGGGAMARMLPPTEKIKVLEDELAKELDRRAKAEEETARRVTENKELDASGRTCAKERGGLEARMAEARDRESQVQKANDRLRQENERIAITVRLALPIVALVCAAILAMLVYTFMLLRKVAERVHGQSTLAEMHALEARAAHLNDQYNAEVKRNQTLRHKLAGLGIVDEESLHTPTGQWRTK